jgi:hypothetical protein
MPPKKGSHKRTQYALLKPRFMRHEWATLEQMAEELKLSYNTVKQSCAGWATERRAFDLEVESDTMDELKLDLVQMRVDMMKRHLIIARKLQDKALGHLFAKYTDAKGKVRDVPFTSDSVALGVLRLGVGVEQTIVNPKSSTPGAGDSGAMPIIDIGGDVENVQERLRLADPAHLQALLKDLDAQDRSEKGDPAGAKGPSRGTNKRS